MKYLLFVALLTSCAKTEYQTPTIGMPYASFVRLCGYGPNDNSNAVTNRQGTTFTVTLGTDEGVMYGTNTSSNRRDKGCVGRFTFVADKLDTMSSL